MSLFVILGLLVCIQAQGIIVTPVFVLKGRDLLLKFDADLPEEFDFVDWKFNKTVTLVRFEPSGEPIVHENSTGRLEFPEKNFSVTLKNLQEADSGLYAAEAFTFTGDKLVAEYKVTVQGESVNRVFASMSHELFTVTPPPSGPVTPVELIVDRVDSNSSESCDLHVTCRTHNSNISSTFRCVDRVCSQEGGERSEVTTSGASLQVYLLNSTIICNHSNQVHWTHDFNTTEHFCPEHPGPVLSALLLRTVVISVGLIIMVSAVITVHLVDFKKHQ
uniref:Immunoglobulin subtype domain-containing protein n=1 Tax=Gasterosteus aculeatus aculeatus TaxID=481459 RepID=G3PZE7_GASAC